MTTQPLPELSFWRSLGQVSRLKKLAIVTLAIFLILCVYSARLYTTVGIEFDIEKIKDLVAAPMTDYSQPFVRIQDHDAETAARKKNFMFIKTHKCGTSSLVNVFYLLGVRRKLNFVIQRGDRAHNIQLEMANGSRSLF